MRKARKMGSYIQYLAESEGITEEAMSAILGCKVEEVRELYRGLLYPDYARLCILAERFKVSVSEIIEGNEEIYREQRNKEMGTFENEENRERVLDIIEAYYDIAKSIC